MSDPNQPADGDPFAPPPAGGSANIPGIPGDGRPPLSELPRASVESGRYSFLRRVPVRTPAMPVASVTNFVSSMTPASV